MNLTKKYSVIYADPPRSYNDKGCEGNADSHYKTMSVNEICKLPIKEITEKIVFYLFGLHTRWSKNVYKLLKVGALNIKQSDFNGSNKIKAVMVISSD